MRKQALAIFGTLLCSHVIAGDSVRVNLAFFSMAAPSGWHVETDREGRLLASASGRAAPPLLIVEACQPLQGRACPSRCDLPAIEHSGVVSDLHLAFTPVQRHDGYFEYAAADQQDSTGGKVFTAIRMLCGPAGFVYAALAGADSQPASQAALTAIVDSIQWAK